MSRINRRKALKLAGTGALATAGGMAGILATGRMPAFAQQKTVHWLKWVDFVPASDTLLRKELLPEAEKALGIKINMETVNGNDLQPRVTAAIQSGAGPDLIMAFNNQTYLYANSVVDMTALAEEVGKREGGLFKYARSICSDGKMFMSMPWAVIGGMVAYRKSWFEEIGVTKFPETWEQYRDAAKKLKAKGHPIGQTLGHTFGDAPGFTYPYMWSWGGKEVEADGKTVVINSKETIESVKFMQAFWKEGHQQQSCLPVTDHLGHAERRLDLHRVAAQARSVHDGKRHSDEQGHPACGPAQGAGGTVRLPSPAVAYVDEVFEESGCVEGVPEVDPHRSELRKVVHLAKGLRHAVHREVGDEQALGCGSGHDALQGGSAARPSAGLCRPTERHGGGRAIEIHHHRYVRQGRAGNAGRGLGEVGRGRTEEGLRLAKA